MSQKITTTTECLLNRKVEFISGKWYNDEEGDSQEHQVMQGMIGNIPEDEKSECNNTSGVLDTLKAQDANPKCECENILEMVNKKSPKRPRRLYVTRNKDFLWTTSARTNKGRKGK